MLMPFFMGNVFLLLDFVNKLCDVLQLEIKLGHDNCV